jgi:NAD(P)-dependent dehydrogenase (short-subunit alcohol dehydrogenase family)
VGVSAGKSDNDSDDLDPAWRDWLDASRLFSLAGKVAVVTGAAGGIGRWLAAGMAAAGASVFLTDREAGTLDALVGSWSKRDWDVASLPVDLEIEDAAEQIVSGVRSRFGHLDILINNAGINQRLPMLDVPSALLHHIWEIDFIRCYELAQAAARVMIDQGHGGSIVHISSVNTAVGLEDVSLLGPTKAALSQLAKGMAIELAHYGIRTNAIAPGFMVTPINATHWSDETRAPWIMGRTPMCRPGHPAELVGTCLLLASDAGSFITGQTIFVDGGFTAGSRWNVSPSYGLEAFLKHGGFCAPQRAQESTPTGLTDSHK